MHLVFVGQTTATMKCDHMLFDVCIPQYSVNMQSTSLITFRVTLLNTGHSFYMSLVNSFVLRGDHQQWTTGPSPHAQWLSEDGNE